MVPFRHHVTILIAEVIDAADARLREVATIKVTSNGESHGHAQEGRNLGHGHAQEGQNLGHAGKGQNLEAGLSRNHNNNNNNKHHQHRRLQQQRKSLLLTEKI